MENISHKLTEFLQAHVPTTQYMGIDVGDYDGNSLSLTAPLQPNINDKQTAFGGSLYTVCVMNCWGMVYLKTLEKGISCNQVVAQSNISYHAPVDGEIISICESPNEETLNNFFARYEEKGRSKITLHAEVQCNGKTAVKFEGTYAIIKNDN